MVVRKKPLGGDAPAAAPAGRRKGFKGLEKVMVRLRPEQAAALRAEAFRRAAASFARPDASEIVREILDGKLDPAKVFGRR